MEWMILPLRRYADFSGRSQRKEYWMFALLTIIIYGILGVALFGVTDLGEAERSAGLSTAGSAISVLFLLVVLGLLVPSLALQIRRLHDQDKSGWWILINLVPYVGGIILLIIMCLPGTRGPNSYGDDPKDPLNDLVDTFG